MPERRISCRARETRREHEPHSHRTRMLHASRHAPRDCSLRTGRQVIKQITYVLLRSAGIRPSMHPIVGLDSQTRHRGDNYLVISGVDGFTRKARCKSCMLVPEPGCTPNIPATRTSTGAGERAEIPTGSGSRSRAPRLTLEG